MTSRAATEYRYEKLTWPEINDAVELGKVCVVPCGAVEQHGPHLPLDVDLVCPTGIARGAGREVPDKMLVLPIVAYGYTGHVMDFPGTINNDFEHFMHHVLDITKSLAYHGFKKIILLNGHGSNMPNLDLVARRTNLETDAECVLAAWWNLLTVDKEFLPRWRQSKFPGGCAHACELETSLYLYLDGDNVRKDQIKNGVISFNEDEQPVQLGRSVRGRPGDGDLVDEQLFRDGRARRGGAGHGREGQASLRGGGQAAGALRRPGSRTGRRTSAQRPARQAADHADSVGAAAGEMKSPLGRGSQNRAVLRTAARHEVTPVSASRLCPSSAAAAPPAVRARRRRRRRQDGHRRIIVAEAPPQVQRDQAGPDQHGVNADRVSTAVSMAGSALA